MHFAHSVEGQGLDTWQTVGGPPSRGVNPGIISGAKIWRRAPGSTGLARADEVIE